MKNDCLLSLRAAADVMGCGYTKVQRMAKAGELPFRKLGGTWAIPRSALYRELGLEDPDKDKETIIG